jgi:hypothetical protein
VTALTLRRSWAFPVARAYPFAFFAFLRALYGWYGYRANISPDFGLYLRGGLHLYPSPLGVALGSFLGVSGLVLLSALAAAAVPLWVSRYSSGYVALACVTFLPLGWITFFAAIDWIAAALFLFAWCNRGSRVGKVGLCVACLLHFALVPVLLALAVRRYLSVRSSPALWGTFGLLLVPLVSASLLVLLVTPYGGIAGHFASPLRVVYYAVITAVVAGGAWQAVAILPWVRVHGSAFLADGVVAFAVGALEAGAQLHSQARYCFVGFVLLCSALRQVNRGERS